MWNRDLNQRSTKGHVDFPRLAEAGVKLQCFTVVTHGFPIVGGFPVFAAWRGWPVAAMKNEWTRCQFQIDRLHALCAASRGAAAIADSPQALADNLRHGRLSAVLGIEGGHALQGQVERIAQLHAQGVRFMGLTHLSANELGGSSHPLGSGRALSPLGHTVVDEMTRVGMSVDLAHASRRTLDDIASHTNARLFCSHTGVQGAHANWRNLDDAALRLIAERGGVAGIIFGTVYLGGGELSDVARHIEHAVNVMGEDSVGLGSDFDGMVPLPRGMRDVTGLPRLTEELLGRGHSEAWVEKILGENFRRFFERTL